MSGELAYRFAALGVGCTEPFGAESWDGRHAWGHGVAVVVCEVVGGLDDEVEVGVVVVFEGFGDVHGVRRFEAEFFGERAHAVVFA